MGTRMVCFYGELPTIAQYVQPLHHGQTFPLSNVLIRRYAWEMRPYWMCLQDQLVMFKHVCSYIFDPSTSSVPRPVGPLGNPMPAWDLILQRFPDYEDPQFPHRLPDNRDLRRRIGRSLTDDFRREFYERVRAQTAASVASWGKERIRHKVRMAAAAR